MTLRNLTSRIRLVYKRSNTLTKVAVCAASVLSTAALLTLRSAALDAQADREALQQEAQRLEQEQNQLNDKLDSLGSADSVEQIAKDELGLVDPDTIIITPGN